MMDSLSLEEENIIKDKRNPFRLKEGLNYTVNKEIRNIFKREKKNRDIKHGILIDLFEHEKAEKNCYKHVSAKNFWSNNYIEYKSNSDRNRTLSVEEYLHKIRPYLKDITNSLIKCDTLKIQLTAANNFISSTDNDEERVMHSKGDNMETIINDEADKVINENEKICYTCKKKFLNNKRYCKVRDHCHFTGEYRGAADSICNLKYSVPKKILIAFS